MSKKKIAAVVALVGCTFSGGYVFGQDAAQKQFEEELDLAYGRVAVAVSVASRSTGAEAGRKVYDASYKLGDAYAKAVGNSDNTKFAVNHALGSYFAITSLKEGGENRSGASVRLQAIQVMQNQRIIELLEQQKEQK